MHTTNLRKVGGSIMLAVPPAILDLLHLEVGAVVGLEVDGERLVIDVRAEVQSIRERQELHLQAKLGTGDS